MKKLIAVAAFIAIGIQMQAQVLRAFSPRYSNTSVRGNIVFVSNGIITSSGGVTTEAAPAGTSSNNGRAGMDIDVDAAPAPVNFINWGSSWKYLANNTRPAGWQTTAFSDVAWPAGNSELGYGDGDEATVVGFGGVAANKYITTLFRKTVNIVNPSAFLNFRMGIEYDDGFVVYVNGVEVGRGNMPTGAVTNATVAIAAIEDQVTTLTIPASAFVAGNNVIAVEIHQSSANSSDISFNMLLDGSNDLTFNSSSADLSLSSCSHVLWAGLYWGATQGTDGTNTSWITGEKNVKLKLPGAGTYTDITASQTDYHNGTLVPGLPHTGYRCFADVTALIDPINPNGTYTLANMASPAGIINTSGGWTIVIVYSNPAEIPRNLTVFDGSAIMNGGDPAMDVNISGFLTPIAGPVSCELGAIVFDGDRVSTDEFSFKQASAGTFTNLTPNATSNLNDMWNSTITYKGVNVATRNPAHQNTHGYDADILQLPNAGNAVLGNGQMGATVRFSSPSENYFIQVLTTSISILNPSFRMVKTATDVNGGVVNPGDVIRYQMDYTNVGNDNSAATTVIDNVPSNTSYKPGSISINGVAKTDAAGDDEAEYDFANNRVVFRLGTGANATIGGQVLIGAAGSMRFEVYAPTSCAVIACNNTISNSARIEYNGPTSLQSLFDSSGSIIGGCFIKGPVTNSISGTCSARGDTTLVNLCPSTTVMLPVALYGGYQFYRAMPFSPATAVNSTLPVTFSRVIYAFSDGPGSCDDTLVIRVFVNPCPDIDDDNDGLPDYLEANLSAAFGDHDIDGIPNYLDVSYPGFVDFNSDAVNDNFDPSADSDNDGLPNFLDKNFPGFVDGNGDGVNDNFDADKDGIPNHLDIDADNDGIPDVAESFGVDNNGDGRIDNYSDSDADGFSQNVDANSTGPFASGLGLTAVDTDADGIPNYLDLDSDNDGIPDVIEVYATDANNDGMVDNFIDIDGDGLIDTADGDVGNDGTAENSSNALLRTGTDANNDGRADNFPFKNMDADTRPNPYDLDSDADGIVDVLEAQLPDANFDGRIDGALNAKGWSTTVAALPSLVLPDRDGMGRINVYDIDSDDDGIPDNVEGQCTPCYMLPAGLDSDGDGIDNTYDNVPGFGGKGITVFNMDGDPWPDYLDFDTDGDGKIDRIEGNDLNFDEMPNDNITLTGLDTDDDGLDDRFDNNNSSCEGTSKYMGNGGSFTGDASPGSITVVQQTIPWYADRDWRMVNFVLSSEYLNFSGSRLGSLVTLNWTVLCKETVLDYVVQRSLDGVHFEDIQLVKGSPLFNIQQHYAAHDDLSSLHASQIWYRIKARSINSIKYSNHIFILTKNDGNDIRVVPNPVVQNMQLIITSAKPAQVQIRIIDIKGNVLLYLTEKVAEGMTSIPLPQATKWPGGIYTAHVSMLGKNYNIKIMVQR